MRQKLFKAVRSAASVLTATSFLLFSTPVHAATTPYLFPNSDGPVTWTSSTGSANWENVDDSTSCDGYGTYNYTEDPETDIYGVSLSSVPNGSTITKIEIIPCYVSTSTVKLHWLWKVGDVTSSTIRSPLSVFGDSTTSTWFVSLAKSAGSHFAMGMEDLDDLGGRSVLSRLRVVFTY